MQRLKVADPQLAESWGIIDKNDASEFIKNAEDLYGMDLRKAMENLIQETVIKTMSFEFKSGGRFFDEEYFDKTYEGREEQKKNIFANSKRYVCKVRGVTLYQDPNYSECTTERHKEIEERKRKLIQDQQLKVKKAKVATKAKMDRKAKAICGKKNEDDKVAKTLTATETKRLNTMSNKLVGAVKKLKDIMKETENESIKQNIPLATAKRSEDTLASADQKICAIQLAIDEKHTINFQEEISAGKDLLENVEGMRKSLSTIIKFVKVGQ